MGRSRLYEVRNKQTENWFLSVPFKIYNLDSSWVPIPEDEIKAIFNAKTNPFFSHGECARWVLSDDAGQPVGRIAAFINFEKKLAGGIGFFECIDEQQEANTLFNVAKEWLVKKGMTAMEGPVNFGENDKYWGLLIEGFHSPSHGMNYNPPYYKKLFEQYGFVKAYDQYTNVLYVQKPLPERFTKIADWVLNKKEYAFRHFTSLHKEKFFSDFLEIYNDAWKNFENFTPMELATVRESFRQMKPIMDDKIIWFAYYCEQPIAFILCLPDANAILKHIKGPLNFFNKLRFLWYRYTLPVQKIRIVVMGCKEQFQNRGIESALIRCLQNELIPRKTVKEVELAWVGDFNKKMLALHEATGATRLKVHRTYLYQF